MAIKNVVFDAFTRATGAQHMKSTGPFGAGDVITVQWTVPEGANITQVAYAQVYSDAWISLTFQGRTKNGLLGSMFSLKNPPAGEYSAVITTDQSVRDCHVYVTVQVPKA